MRRRRFSKRWHEEVILTLKDDLGEQFTGTSNVYYAMKHNLTLTRQAISQHLDVLEAVGLVSTKRRVGTSSTTSTRHR